MAKQSKLKQHEDDKKLAAQSRQNELQTRNFSGAKSFDELNDGLSGEEISSLYRSNQSFHATTDRLNDEHATIQGFRAMTSEQQAAFFQESNEATKTLLAEDGYVAEQTQTLAPSLVEAEEVRDAQRQFEQDRLSEESRAAETQNNTQEILYEGCEKLADGRYRLTVDAGEGAQPEIFYGNRQGECWAALRKSKAHATAALRRRAKDVQLTRELREMKVAVVNYPPLMEKITLTPEQVYQYTVEQSDPTTSVEAIRMLRLGGMSQDEVDRINAAEIRAREQEAYTTASKWITSHPEFYACDDNLKALRDLMGGLNWACVSENFDLALKILQEQDALVDKLPEVEPEFHTGPEPKPRTVFIPKAAPVEAPKVAPAPATRPSRRPLNNSGIGFREARMNTEPVKPQPMTAVEYAGFSAVELKTRYNRDESFRARVDAYWAAGGR